VKYRKQAKIKHKKQNKHHKILKKLIKNMHQAAAAR